MDTFQLPDQLFIFLIDDLKLLPRNRQTNLLWQRGQQYKSAFRVSTNGATRGTNGIRLQEGKWALCLNLRQIIDLHSVCSQATRHGQTLVPHPVISRLAEGVAMQRVGRRNHTDYVCLVESKISITLVCTCTCVVCVCVCVGWK